MRGTIGEPGSPRHCYDLMPTDRAGLAAAVQVVVTAVEADLDGNCETDAQAAWLRKRAARAEALLPLLPQVEVTA